MRTERLIRLAALMSAVALAGCDFGGDDASPGAASSAAATPSPSPAPTPSPAPATGSCGTMTALAISALDAYDGTYAVNVMQSNDTTGDTTTQGTATLTVGGGQVTYTPASGLSNTMTVAAAAVAVCQNTDSSGAPIGVTVMFGENLHLDFFSPAFNSLYVSGDELGNTGSTYRFVQGTTAVGVVPAAPSPSPSPAPAPSGALTTYLDFAAAAPSATPAAVAPSGALTWLAGTYYGRSSAGVCSVTIGADGSVSATMNGSTQSAALNGESGDTWIQLPSNSMSFGVVAAGTGQGINLSGFAGRLAIVEVAGVLDKCAIAFKSSTALAMTLASTPPVPVVSSGLQASDLPSWLVGTHQGYIAGTALFPQTSTAACSLQVAADGTAVLNANGRSYTAQVSGGSGSSTSGDRDSSAATRQSAYAALTGARDWVWSIKAQSPSGPDTVEVTVELAYTTERSQVSYAIGQVRPSAGGLASQLDACYFVN